ncbi:MAG: hypothetical protein HQK88_14980 [Nitrospirae bacterium]|nr:hypothetical protein [Nitrospirota bacterium]MBF0618104.1 hypothetical protein [Nitrospirota bacterium]
MLSTIDFNLPFRLKKKSGYVVAACPVFDIVTQGSDEQHAKDNLTEATRLFLLTCIEKGTIDEVFKQCGFEPLRIHKKKTQNDNRYIHVSLPFTAHGQNECNACRP